MNNLVSTVTVSKFFFKNKKEIFNFNQFITINERKINKGILILCKYLHLSQILFFAKYEKLLFEDNLLAFENGTVINSIRIKFNILNNSNDELFCFNNTDRELNYKEQNFLKKILFFLSGADYKELIKLSHLVPVWIEANNEKNYLDVMNIKKYKHFYKENFKQALEVIDNIEKY